MNNLNAINEQIKEVIECFENGYSKEWVIGSLKGICDFISKQDDDLKISDCGCRFENHESNAVILCEECSNLPCHTGKCVNL